MITSVFALGTSVCRALKYCFSFENSLSSQEVTTEGGPFVKKLYILGTLVSIFGVAVYLTPYPVKFLPQILLGSMFAHGVELLHELNHRKKFLKKYHYKVTLMLGLPMLISPSLYDFLHGLHHRYLGTSLDTESFSYNYEQITTAKGFILHLSMMSHYLTSLGRMRASVFDAMDLRDDMPFSIKIRVQKEFRLMAGCIAIMLIFSVVLHTMLFLDVWLIPLVFGAGPVHALIELPEHIGCDSSSTDIFKNTRSIQASKFAEWFTNGNCFHTSHHMNASWDISSLRNYHNQIASKIENLQDSYLQFYHQLFKDILRNSFKINL
jgi:fatty acid desaturase